MADHRTNTNALTDAFRNTLESTAEAVVKGYGVTTEGIQPTNVGVFIEDYAREHVNDQPLDQLKLLADFADGKYGEDHAEEARRVYTAYLAGAYTTGNSSAPVSKDVLESTLGVSILDPNEHLNYLNYGKKSDIVKSLGNTFSNGVKDLDIAVDNAEHDVTNPDGLTAAKQAKDEYVAGYINGNLKDFTARLYTSNYLEQRNAMCAFAYNDPSTLDMNVGYAAYAESVITCAKATGYPDCKMPTKEEVSAAFKFLKEDETSRFYNQSEQEINAALAAEVNQKLVDTLQQTTGYDKATCDRYINLAQSLPSAKPAGKDKAPVEANQNKENTKPTPSTPKGSSGHSAPTNSSGTTVKPGTQMTETRVLTNRESKTIEQLINEGRFEEIYPQLTNGNTLSKDPSDDLHLSDSFKDAMRDYVEAAGNNAMTDDIKGKMKKEMLAWCGEIGILDMKASVDTYKYSDGKGHVTYQIERVLPTEAKAAAEAYRESEGNHHDGVGTATQMSETLNHDTATVSGTSAQVSDNPYTAENIRKRYEEAKDDPRKMAELDYEIANAVMEGKIGSGEDRVNALGDNYDRIQQVTINGAVYNGLKTFQQPGTPGYEEAIKTIMTNNTVFAAAEQQMRGVKGKSMMEVWSDVENLPEVQQMRNDVMNGKSTVENVKEQLSNEKSQQRAALTDYFLGLDSGSEGLSGPEVG